MNKISSFTLAEVLITLGIIGIVAAMTLPTLINKHRNKILETGLKKSYSIILQAFEMYQAEHGERLKPEMLGGNGTTTDLKSQIMPYFKVLIDCDKNGSDKQKECVYVNSTYKTYNGINLNGSITRFDDGQFVLQDGSIILIEDMQGSNKKIISVDVNGRNKNPNKWGHDIFSFQLMDNGQILPVGAPNTYYTNKDEYCSLNSTNLINGIACTYYAINDKDYFNNLPR